MDFMKSGIVQVLINVLIFEEALIELIVLTFDGYSGRDSEIDSVWNWPL